MCCFKKIWIQIPRRSRLHTVHMLLMLPAYRYTARTQREHRSKHNRTSYDHSFLVARLFLSIPPREPFVSKITSSRLLLRTVVKISSTINTIADRLEPNLYSTLLMLHACINVRFGFRLAVLALITRSSLLIIWWAHNSRTTRRSIFLQRFF